MWFKLTWRLGLTILLMGLGVEVVSIIRWLLNYPSDATFFAGCFLAIMAPIAGLWFLIAIWQKLVLDLAEKLGLD